MSAQSRVRSNITLKHRELDRAEHRDPRARERDGAAVARRVLVHRDVVEEQVDRRLVPPQADLPVARDRLLGPPGVLDTGRQRPQRALRCRPPG